MYEKRDLQQSGMRSPGTRLQWYEVTFILAKLLSSCFQVALMHNLYTTEFMNINQRI